MSANGGAGWDDGARWVDGAGWMDGAGRARRARGTDTVRRPLLDVLGELHDIVEEITSVDPSELGGHAAAEAAVAVQRVGDRLRDQQLGWLGRVEADAAWVGTGARSFSSWVARAFDVSFAEAARLARTARTWWQVLPATAAAARSGHVSTAKGALIAATATTPDRVAALREPASDDDPPPSASHGAEPDAPRARTGEELLLTLASGYSVGDFARLTRRFAHVTDPDADERGYRAALAREFFDLASTTGGYHLSGFLTRDHGQVLKAALRGVCGAPASGDTRTASQRRAAALTDVARRVLDHAMTDQVGSVQPHLVVHVTHTELDDLLHRSGACTGARAPASRRRGATLGRLVTSPPAEWEDGTGPIPDSVLVRLASDCQVSRVIFGPQSQVLDVGRTRRTFSGHLRRAVVARDRTCVIDGCSAPAFMGQIHHARIRWADGGPTRLDNAALVCGFHNRWLEDHKVPMRRVTDAQGTTRWQAGYPGTYRPDGSGRFPTNGADPSGAPADDEPP